MKYIFFGTPRFAEIVLAGLIDSGMAPTAVVCNPDRPVGRKKIITPPQTKVLAIQKAPDAEIMQPDKLDEDFIKRVQILEPDFFVVAAYSKILPKKILDIPRLGTLGVHPSLLPKFRGASPIQSAILAGERETGVTIYLMDEKTDHGPILTQEKLANATASASDLPYLDLEEKLARLGARLLAKAIPGFTAAQQATPQPQNEADATHTKKFETADGFVPQEDLTAAENGNQELASKILRKINALNPEPGAWTTIAGKRVKLLQAKMEAGHLRLIETQKEGEKPKITRA